MESPSHHFMDLYGITNEYNAHIDLKSIHNYKEERTQSPSSPADSTTSTSSQHDTIPIVHDPIRPRCGYRTGKCYNLKAFKRNGKLHKLCEFHREKANQNQKRLDQKKRQQRHSPYDQHSDEDEDDRFSMHSYNTSPCSLDQFDLMNPTSLHEEPLCLAEEELAIFYNLMLCDSHGHNDIQQLRGMSHPHYLASQSHNMYV